MEEKETCHYIARSKIVRDVDGWYITYPTACGIADAFGARVKWTINYDLVDCTECRKNAV